MVRHITRDARRDIFGLHVGPQSFRSASIYTDRKRLAALAGFRTSPNQAPMGSAVAADVVVVSCSYLKAQTSSFNLSGLPSCQQQATSPALVVCPVALAPPLASIHPGRFWSDERVIWTSKRRQQQHHNHHDDYLISLARLRARYSRSLRVSCCLPRVVDSVFCSSMSRPSKSLVSGGLTQHQGPQSQPLA